MLKNVEVAFRTNQKLLIISLSTVKRTKLLLTREWGSDTGRGLNEVRPQAQIINPSVRFVVLVEDVTIVWDGSLSTLGFSSTLA